LLKVYALEFEVWEHFSHLSKHSDIYRTVLVLIKMAQNITCLLSCQPREAPAHTADTASLSAVSYHLHGRNA